MIRSTDIHSLTDFTRNAKTYIQQIKSSKNPMAITVNGDAQVVIQDAESFQLMADALEREQASKPMTNAEIVRIKLRQSQEETETKMLPNTSIHELFARWAEEDAKLTEEEVAANDRLWQDFQHGIDEERQNAGMRTLFDG